MEPVFWFIDLEWEKHRTQVIVTEPFEFADPKIELKIDHIPITGYWKPPSLDLSSYRDLSVDRGLMGCSILDVYLKLTREQSRTMANMLQPMKSSIEITFFPDNMSDPSSILIENGILCPNIERLPDVDGG